MGVAFQPFSSELESWD